MHQRHGWRGLGFLARILTALLSAMGSGLKGMHWTSLTPIQDALHSIQLHNVLVCLDLLVPAFRSFASPTSYLCNIRTVIARNMLLYKYKDS